MRWAGRPCGHKMKFGDLPAQTPADKDCACAVCGMRGCLEFRIAGRRSDSKGTLWVPLEVRWASSHAQIGLAECAWTSQALACNPECLHFSTSYAPADSYIQSKAQSCRYLLQVTCTWRAVDISQRDQKVQ